MDFLPIFLLVNLKFCLVIVDLRNLLLYSIIFSRVSFASSFACLYCFILRVPLLVYPLSFACLYCFIHYPSRASIALSCILRVPLLLYPLSASIALSFNPISYHLFIRVPNLSIRCFYCALVLFIAGVFKRSK